LPQFGPFLSAADACGYHGRRLDAAALLEKVARIIATSIRSAATKSVDRETAALVEKLGEGLNRLDRQAVIADRCW